MLVESRLKYAGLALITMALGLISRMDTVNAPEFVVLYIGDLLWAMLIFWLICFLMPNQKNVYVAMSAMIFSFAIEFSQLYQATWINELRYTTLGALILGFGFKWSDLIAYSAGITIGFLLRAWFSSIQR